MHDIEILEIALDLLNEINEKQASKHLIIEKAKPFIKNLMNNARDDVTLNTYRRRLTSIRKVFKNCKYPELLSLITLTDQEKKTFEQQEAAALNQKKENTFIFNRIDVLKNIYRLVESKKEYENLLGLCIASGRRMIEIVKVGSFSSCYQSLLPFQSVNFSGQAKSKNEKITYEIPLLIESDFFVEKFNEFRNGILCLDLIYINDNYTINGRIASTANYYAKKNGLKTFKDSRALYAAMIRSDAKLSRSKLASLDDDLLTKRILGHETLNSGLHYKSIRIN